MTQRSDVRAAFDEEARRWRKELQDRDDEAGQRKDLASRWQQYSETAQEHMFRSATLTKVDNPKRKHTLGNLWWNKGSPPRQATLALKRGSTDMNSMLSNLKQHPLAVGSDGKSNWMMLDGKVNAQPTADQQESVLYNVKDPDSSTHAWVAFGERCTLQLQRQLGVMFC